MSEYNEPWWIEQYQPNEERAEIHYGERTTHPTDGYVTSPVVVAIKVLPTVEYAERIVACVNACRGIPTERLTVIWKAVGDLLKIDLSELGGLSDLGIAEPKSSAR